MKEAKVLIFSERRYSPYVLEDRDLDQITKTILGAFKFSFNFYKIKTTKKVLESKAINDKSLDKQSLEENEINGLRQILEKYVKKYSSKINIEDSENLKNLITEKLISDYLEDKKQGKMSLINEANIKTNILRCIEQCSSKTIVYCPSLK